MLRSPFQIVAKQITPWHLVGVEHADGQLRLAGTVIGMYELAMQPWRSHALTMKFSTRLYSGNIETIPQQDSAALTLSRLQRAFTTQLETLSNLRRGGRQKVVDEHVHVYPGGQAIVGEVTHTGRGAEDKNEGQARATDHQ